MIKRGDGGMSSMFSLIERNISGKQNLVIKILNINVKTFRVELS